jgi:hypothetical protein
MKGDVVLVEGRGFGAGLVKLGNWWTRIFGSKKGIQYSHIGIMISDTEIVEAIGNGVVRRDFPYKKRYQIYRYKDLSPEAKIKLAEVAISQIGDKYNYPLLISLGVLKFLRLEKIVPMSSNMGKICSLVVAKCYDAIGYRFRPSEDIELVDPADIAEDILINHKLQWERVD